MRQRLSVPMTQGVGFGPLPDLVVEGASVRALDTLFSTAALPLAVLEHRTMPVPLAAMAAIFEQAARVLGDRSFGARVGEAMTHEAYGPWLEYSAAAETLGKALGRTVVSMRYHQSHGRLRLDREGAFVVWRYLPPGRQAASVQHSDHVVGPLWRFVASYLGPRWRPAWIDLDYPRDPDWRRIEAHLAAPVRFAQPGVGVAIAAEDLARRRPCAAATRFRTLHDVAASSVSFAEEEPLRSILALVTVRLLDGATDIEGTAALAGLGVRNFQRRLREAGLSYRQAVELARRRRAEALLAETDLSVTEIALALGYADHAGFTRAFTRVAGMPPSAFRKAIRQVGPAGAGVRA